MIRRLLVLIGCLLLPAHPGVQAQVVREHPDPRIGRNIAQVIDKINAGDRADLERFVRAKYTASMLGGMTIESSAEFLLGVHAGRSPIKLCCYQLSERIPEGMGVALLEAADGNWSMIQLRFDEGDKITSLMIVPTRPPAEFANLERLDEAGLVREFDRHLAELAARDEFSGVALIARDGKPLSHKAYGLANREDGLPNELETRFRIGSMNKMFTAVAVAQLVEQGKLSFDDPIGKHLPAGWIAEEIGQQVRVRQLLNHTSGLGDYLEPMLESPLYKFVDLESYRELVAGESLLFEPGSRWDYSNTGFLLLGVIVAHVSGVDYYEYVRRNIYGPAGMKDSDHFDHTVPTPRLSDGYWMHEGALRKNTLLLAPRGTSAGGGYSTAGDLLAFDQALRTDKLLTAAMRDRLFTPDPDRNSASYGYGFMINAMAPNREVGHGGTFPGNSAQLAMFLDSGYTVVALCNGDGAQKAYMKALTLIEQTK